MKRVSCFALLGLLLCALLLSCGQAVPEIASRMDDLQSEGLGEVSGSAGIYNLIRR